MPTIVGLPAIRGSAYDLSDSAVRAYSYSPSYTGHCRASRSSSVAPLSANPLTTLLVPLAFALFALVFVWLYEMWLRHAITGGETADAGNPDVRRAWTAPVVFRTEAVLVCGNLALAHAMLDADWHLHGVRAAAGLLASAVLGVAGCALAVSSSLAQRESRRV